MTTTRNGARRHWLVKSEPDCFSWDDLTRAPGRTTCWDGVRNFQARNLLREVVREAYPDHTAFERSAEHFDPKSDPDSPTWYMVDLRASRALARPLTLPELRRTPGLERMVLLQKGSRLSVQPVRAEEWEIIERLASFPSTPTQAR